MQTATAIENITDAGEFEILAIRVLRLVDSDYACVEHLGVNAEGKTVKNPVDGFCKVPGNQPSRYVMAAFSTDRLQNIEHKLLFDHSISKGTRYTDADDGDLVKASRLAAQIRSGEDDTEFVFTFCTNKQPNEGLMQKGYIEGKELGIEVRFLARSSIRDCLDTTRNGQWLRKKHLGIDADTLSIPLLRQISKDSVQKYLNDLFCSDSQIIDTTTTRRLVKSTRQNQPSIHILTGESGSGKSVASYSVLAEVVSNGGIGIWIPGEIVSASASMDEALTKTLTEIYPTLAPESGHDFNILAAQSNVPFVIVVDDLNRTTHAAQDVYKLISWHRRLSTGETASRAATHHARVPHLIVPVWDHYWLPIAIDFSNSPAVGQVNALPMNADEALECLRKCSKISFELEEESRIVKRLEHDPILIGLWGELKDDNPEINIDAEASTLIERYINRSIEKDSATSKHIPADFREAVETLSARLLEERDLYPAWSRVIDWLSESQIEAIRHLCKSGRICRVVQRSESDKFEFRHDRLLETTLIKPLRKCLADVEKNLDLLTDPFFADSVARTVARSRDPQLIESLKNHAPLVTLSVIRYIDDDKCEFAETVVQAAKDWLIETTRSVTEPPIVLDAACRVLESTQNELVLAVTEDVKEDRRLAGARLVNGDTVHGKHFVANRMFYPNSRAWFIEDLIARAIQQHDNALFEDLAADLNSGDHSEQELHAALTLAGYFGDSSLAAPALSAWRHDRENRCLVEGLWASMRCSDDPASTLAPMLDSWATLPNESNAGDRSARGEVVSHLQFCLRHGVRDCVIEYLAERANCDPRLSGCLAGLLQRIDHPLAVTHVATRVALIEKEIEDTDRFSPWALSCRRNWDPLDGRSGRLSDKSRNALFTLWEQSNEDWLRNSVLHTWIISTDSIEDFDRLPSGAAVSRTALWRRARLGDHKIQDEVLKRLTDDVDWFDVVPPIWGERFIQPLDQALQELAMQTPRDFSGGLSNDHHTLSDVIRDIPVETAEKLLLSHWESLKYSARFVQVALYIGGETLLAAVDQVIQDAPQTWDPLEHLSFTFGFNMVGLQDRLTDRHIDALLRYVPKLADMELMHLADWLVKHGRKEDLMDHVTGEIEKRVAEQKTEGDNSYIVRLKRLNFPSEYDLLDHLSEIENEKSNIWHWCHYSTDRGDAPDQVRSILKKWFLLNPSPERLRIVAEIVFELGHRDDLVWLHEFQNNYGCESSKMIVDGATFAVKRRSLS